MTTMGQTDPQVADLILKEQLRIEETIDLIAAENYPPRAVLQAQGSIFSIKAAEGYPGRRYHAGCEVADRVEQLAIERGKALFKAEHVNVQPHSGTTANLAVYFAVLEVGDAVLGMKLAHGGHLSHGDTASITSRCFQFQHYAVDKKTERIDYDQIRTLALRHRPKMIVAGASSYSRLIDYERLRSIADEVSAYLLTDMAHIAGLVAAEVIPSPVPYSDFVTFTTYKTFGAGRGGVILCRAPYTRKIDKSVFPASQGTPDLTAVAAKAVGFQIAKTQRFRAIQKKTLANAAALAEGFSAKGYRIVSGGTDNHLLLVDLGSKALTGKQAETILASVGLVVNRNAIPYDTLGPEITSGIRLGASAITTRGMGPMQALQIVDWINAALQNAEKESILSEIHAGVKRLCEAFPVYR